ncbi:tetratricopeptide repeat domain-containing protein [Ditylenchus destructor]|nr:tetratricopeptide repeat domain-containing protein [Ditylenchus destructor]
MDKSLNQDIRDAVCAIKSHDYEAAVEYGKAILDKGNQMRDHDVLCRGHRILGLANMELAIRVKQLVSSFTYSEYNDIECEGCAAESYLNIALEHFEKQRRFSEKGSELYALAIGCLANVCYYTQNYSAAINLYLQFLELAKEAGSHQDVTKTYKNLANAYRENGDLKNQHACLLEAISYLEGVVEVLHSAKDTQLSALEFDDYFDGYSANEFQLADPKMFERNASSELSMKSDKSGFMRALLRRLSSVFLPNRDLKSERETNSEN